MRLSGREEADVSRAFHASAERETHPQPIFGKMTVQARRILLGGTFVAFALGLLFLLGQLHGADGRPWVPRVAIVIGAGIAGVLGVVAARAEGEAAGTPRVLWSGAPPPAAPPTAASAYRGAAPAPWMPRTSARRTALVMSACLVFTGAAVPLSLHLPRWVELEAALAGWWLVWAVVLTVVARRGAELVDDHALVIRLPWSLAPAPGRARATAAPTPTAETPPPRSSWWSKIVDALSFPGDLEALVFVVGLAVVLGVALAGAWLMIEVVAPVLFAVAYFGVVRALRRAADYRGSTVRASVAGAGWATAYVAPLAAMVWLVHLVAQR
jgi:hypothetical protein